MIKVRFLLKERLSTLLFIVKRIAKDTMPVPRVSVLTLLVPLPVRFASETFEAVWKCASVRLFVAFHVLPAPGQEVSLSNLPLSIIGLVLRTSSHTEVAFALDNDRI